MATVDLRPGTLNVKSVCGDTIALPVTISEAGVPADLSGRTYLAQIRRTKTGDVAVEVDVGTAGAADGLLVLQVDAADTADLAGGYVWDLQETAGGATRTILAGTWTFDPDVTRDDP